MKFGCFFAAKCADTNRFMRSDSASCIDTFCVLPFVCCHSFCKLLVAFNLPFSKSTEKVKNMQRNSEIGTWRAYPRTQTSNVDKLSATCRMQSFAPKRPPTKGGPAVLAPLGAFGSAGPRRACGVLNLGPEHCLLLSPDSKNPSPWAPPYPPTPPVR